MRHLLPLYRRRALPSLAMAALLVPAAELVRRDPMTPPPAAEALGADTIPLGGPSGALAAGEAPDGLASPSELGADVAGAVPAEAAALPAPAAAASAALSALGAHVRRMSHPSALETAFQAYFAYQAEHPERVKKPYLYFVDLGLDNLTARGYVFDMEQLTVVEGPFMVAHGRGSAAGGDGVPASFSNRPGSNASSLGLYLAAETYGFSGTSSGRKYRSVGLRMDGESPGFNDAARRRGIVAHGAPYVTATRAGRSEGCPAMEPERAERLLPLISNGGVVFIYSPNDPRWLGSDPWVQASRGF